MGFRAGPQRSGEGAAQPDSKHLVAANLRWLNSAECRPWMPLQQQELATKRSPPKAATTGQAKVRASSLRDPIEPMCRMRGSSADRE
jgi:hypothetical protein